MGSLIATIFTVVVVALSTLAITNPNLNFDDRSSAKMVQEEVPAPKTVTKTATKKVEAQIGKKSLDSTPTPTSPRIPTPSPTPSSTPTPPKNSEDNAAMLAEMKKCMIGDGVWKNNKCTYPTPSPTPSSTPIPPKNSQDAADIRLEKKECLLNGGTWPNDRCIYATSTVSLPKTSAPTTSTCECIEGIYVGDNCGLKDGKKCGPTIPTTTPPSSTDTQNKKDCEHAGGDWTGTRCQNLPVKCKTPAGSIGDQICNNAGGLNFCSKDGKWYSKKCDSGTTCSGNECVACTSQGQVYKDSVPCCFGSVKVVTPYGAYCGKKGDCVKGEKKCQKEVDFYFEYICDSSGYYQKNKRCDFGCGDNNSCVSSCTPGATTCRVVGDTSSGTATLETCSPDGTNWSSKTCSGICTNIKGVSQCADAPKNYCKNKTLVTYDKFGKESVKQCSSKCVENNGVFECEVPKNHCDGKKAIRYSESGVETIEYCDAPCRENGDVLECDHLHNHCDEDNNAITYDNNGNETKVHCPIACQEGYAGKVTCVGLEDHCEDKVAVRYDKNGKETRTACVYECSDYVWEGFKAEATCVDKLYYSCVADSSCASGSKLTGTNTVNSSLVTIVSECCDTGEACDKKQGKCIPSTKKDIGASCESGDECISGNCYSPDEIKRAETINNLNPLAPVWNESSLIRTDITVVQEAIDAVVNGSSPNVCQSQSLFSLASKAAGSVFTNTMNTVVPVQSFENCGRSDGVLNIDCGVVGLTLVPGVGEAISETVSYGSTAYNAARASRTAIVNSVDDAASLIVNSTDDATKIVDDLATPPKSPDIIGPQMMGNMPSQAADDVITLAKDKYMAEGYDKWNAFAKATEDSTTYYRPEGASPADLAKSLEDVVCLAGKCRNISQLSTGALNAELKGTNLTADLVGSPMKNTITGATDGHAWTAVFDPVGNVVGVVDGTNGVGFNTAKEFLDFWLSHGFEMTGKMEGGGTGFIFK